MLKYDMECSEGLLSTDIALIALNETHAVFSIRIARATLAENHFFLNAISDVAGGDDRLQLPPHALPARAEPEGRPIHQGVSSGWGKWIGRRRSGSVAKRA
ncbi:MULTISPECIES: hypothetical protein [unclassified Bradyrhizobium]|uniref:hypothetical protein n=1 Tax=unclassified Bradyrhizobium TaxID=2631580 RepID=UPI002FEED608